MFIAPWLFPVGLKLMVDALKAMLVLTGSGGANIIDLVDEIAGDGIER